MKYMPFVIFIIGSLCFIASSPLIGSLCFIAGSLLSMYLIWRAG